MVFIYPEKVATPSTAIQTRRCRGSGTGSAKVLRKVLLPATLCVLLLAGIISPIAADSPLPGKSKTVLEYKTVLDTDSEVSLRRIAILVGANDGGTEREPLRYAVSDALALREVFTTIGGIAEADCLLQMNPDKEELLRALARVESLAAATNSASQRVEVIFYYSGHSDVEGLLLGGEHLLYKTLRSRLERIPAAVRIAILDSCFSGAFTRLKGGTKQMPFMTETGYDMKGYAFLSSSSSNEASQESDRLQGSFFTHSLVAGLRGAADHNEDERVTLNELYQFAYNETLSRTEKTFAGPQHPNYSIQMSGTGDVVITQIRSGGSVLVLSETLAGRISIRDSQARLVTEIQKEGGRHTNLVLRPESYTILYEAGGTLFQAKVNLDYGSTQQLVQNDFKVVAYEHTRLRGDETPADYRVVPFALSAAPIKNYSDKVLHHTALGLLGSYSTALDGISAGLGVGVVEQDARWLMANAIGNYAGGDTEGFQLTFILNYFEGDSRYIQFASLGNYVRGSLVGIQSAGIANIVGADLDGLQSGGVFNYTAGKLTGFQTSVANLAKEVVGVQAGVVNWTGKVQGMQIGLINLTGEMNGVPIGLINISKNGGVELQAWAGGQTDFNTAVLFRSGPVYTRFTIGSSAPAIKGINPGNTTALTSFGIYFGIRVPLGPLFIDLDAGVAALDYGKAGIEIDPDNRNSEDILAPQARVAVGYNLTTRFSLFTGIGGSYAIDLAAPEKVGAPEPLWVIGSSIKLF